MIKCNHSAIRNFRVEFVHEKTFRDLSSGFEYMIKAKELVPKFFDNSASNYDTIVSWTTFGKDRIWKRYLVNCIHLSESEDT